VEIFCVNVALLPILPAAYPYTAGAGDGNGSGDEEVVIILLSAGSGSAPCRFHAEKLPVAKSPF
jgi:hypothetical protein